MGDAGCYLFLTQKNVILEAEQKLDNLFESLAKQGHENFPEMNNTPTHGHKDKKAHMETNVDDNAGNVSLSPPLSRHYPDGTNRWMYWIPSHHQHHAGYLHQEDAVD